MLEPPPEEIKSVSIVDIDLLVTQAKEAVASTSYYPKHLQEPIEKFRFQMTEQLYDETRRLYRQLLKSGDAERFYSKIYADIVLNADTYFPGLKKPHSTLFATKFVDKLLLLSKPEKEVISKAKPITEPEMDALQYLAGYVVKKFLKKYKNSPNYKNYQPVISLLESMLSEDTGQKLIAVQNRGGLSAVNTSIQHLFLKVEEKFRQQTTFDNIRKIDIARITSDLISNQDVISYFNTHYDTSGILLEKEIKKNLLENMIKLFCRVLCCA